MASRFAEKMHELARAIGALGPALPVTVSYGIAAMAAVKYPRISCVNIADRMLATVVRHWPFANGAGRIIDKYGKHVDLGTGLRDVVTAKGFRMSVMADDHIGRHILLSGDFDPSIVHVLMDFAEVGDQCLDVGANIGYTSCMLLSRIKDSSVLSVEPQPRILELLRKNLSQFPEARWRIVDAGLSDGEGEGFLLVDSSNHGAGRLVENADAASFRVPLLPAEEVIGSLPRLDLMKIDVEGFEEVIFRAGAKSLQRLQPRAILFEDALHKSAPDGAIGAMLTAMGYAIYAIDKRLFSTRLVPLNPGDRPDWNDYLAVSRHRKLPEKALARYEIQP